MTIFDYICFIFYVQFNNYYIDHKFHNYINHQACSM